MGKAINYNHLFKIRDLTDHVFDNNCIVIDNFYENVEELYQWISNRDYPLWKYYPERGETRNSLDYYDCRINDKMSHPNDDWMNDLQRVENLCKKYYRKAGYTYDIGIEINCFQTINVFDNKFQHYPHSDAPLENTDDFSTLNMIVYLDKKEDGGTAVYDGAWITNQESKNLLYPVEEKFTLNKVIEHKFNRCVIFPGNVLHGAYINNYENYCGDDWRFSQIRFLEPKK